MGHIYLTPSQLTSGGLITAILRSRSLKVTDFCTNRKPICDFLLAINKNVHLISHRFLDFAYYWSNFRFRQGVPVFNTLVRNEPTITHDHDV